jgi:hypothetical protein
MLIEPDWEFVADGVMGGRSRGALAFETVAGQPAARLTGSVSLANDGGFIQMAADLEPVPFDASEFTGIAFETIGNGEAYDLRLRTTDLDRPWQSYRAGFTAPGTWTEVRLDFAAFEPHRTDIPLNLQRLRRIGILAIGRAFDADVAIRNVRLR